MARAGAPPQPPATDHRDPAADQPHPGRRSPIALFDPGWLFVLAGTALIAASVLIPAADDLADVRYQRDRAQALERHRLQRLDHYQQYLAALERQEPSLVTTLAATQLNQIPAGRQLVLEPANLFSDPAGSVAASPFVGLEPPPLVMPQRRPIESTLHRLTTHDATRPWIMAGGVLLLLLGLLPRSRS